MAATEGTAQARAPSATASCTFDGQPSGSDIGNVAGTGITVQCTGIIGGYLLSYSSPLAGLPNLTLTDQTNLTLGTKSGSSTGTTTFSVPPEGTTPPNADGTCPPTQAQVDAGMTNCSVAVTNILGTTLYGYAVVNYADQPAPDTTTLTLTPSSGPAGTKVTVSGSNWWGDALNPNVSPTITIGDVAPATSSVTIPPTTYKPGPGPNGSGGTLTGGTITGDFTIPTTAPAGPNKVVISEPNTIPANDPPYSGATISATSDFTVETAASSLQALSVDVQGVGPGASLAAKVARARAQVAAGDMAAARGTVVAFIHEVLAQDGKTIPPATASQLLDTARLALTLLS